MLAQRMLIRQIRNRQVTALSKPKVVAVLSNQSLIQQQKTDRVTSDLLMRLLQMESDLDQLVGQLVETQDQLLAMYDLSKATRSDLRIDEILRRLAAEAARLVRTDCAVLYVSSTMIQYPADLIDERSLLDLFHAAQASERDLIINASSAQLPVGVENLCVLPFCVGEKPAALALANRDSGFTAPDLKLARAIAEQASAQIERARLYQETIDQARNYAEMNVARKVQLHLLPQSRPSLKGLEIYAESRPALQVGGDFYDFVIEPDRPPTLLLGDVAGKGISAAMIMGMIHVATRSAARFMPNATPASILSRANNDLYDDLTLLDAFATTFIVQYEMAQQKIRFANAGHAPVIYRPPGGPAQMLEGDGVPVGVLPISLCDDYMLDFSPGSLLVVTTDGFSEARDPAGEMFGYERLLALVDEFADQPSQVIAYGLFDAIDSFSAGQPREDDQTLIVVKGTL